MINGFGIAAALLQVSVLPPPAPPAPPQPGTEAFDSQMDNYRAELRADCMTEAGIEAAVRYRVLQVRKSAAESPKHQAATREVAEAALTPPIDVDRLERAMAEQARVRNESAAAYDVNALSLLRALSPADRIIFARRLTIMRPATPPKKCVAPAIRR
ncbi:MAG TPA: hypothetical protein VF655_13110 [Allosphingosinicella sp.]|jgi:hypothetical protein